MDLGDYLKRVLKWWWLVVLSTGIAAGVSYYVSDQQPRIYQTTTTLLVGQIIQQENPTGQDFLTIERLAESYAQIAVRQPVLQAAIDNLGLRMSWQFLKRNTNVYPVARTQLLGISVQDTSPERAVAIADEIARQLIMQSPTSPQNENRTERNEFIKTQLDALENRIKSSEERLAELRVQLDAAFSAREIQDIQTEISSLESLISNWQANYADLSAFLEGGNSPNYLSIIEPAQLPSRPVSPNVQLNVLLAAAAGFALALGAALLVEYIDDTIKTTKDLERASGQVVLGSVSRIQGKDYQDKLALAHTPFSSIGEAYRLIRTNIQFMGVDEPARVLMITSANLGEGKSTTTANLAIVMAQSDLKTVLIDGDLRKPSIHRVFMLPNSEGLTDLIRLSDSDVREQLKNTEYENLQVITSGPLPPNSAELLGSKRMMAILEELSEIADVVIIDSPPLLAATDAIVLSKRVDGVVLVVSAKHTRRDALKQAVNRLRQVESPILGCVFNRVNSEDGGYYYGYYSSGEKAAPAGPVKRFWRGLKHQRWFPFGNRRTIL